MRPPKPAQPLFPGTGWLERLLGGLLNRLWGRGFRFLFLLDAVALLTTMVTANLVRFGVHWPTYALSYYAVGFSTATVIHLFINYFVGLYEREPRLGSQPWLAPCVMATFLGAVFQGLASLLLDRYLMPRLNLVFVVIVGSIVLTVNRRISSRLARRRQGPPRVVLVGPPDATVSVAGHLRSTQRVEVVASVHDTSDLADVAAMAEATDIILLDVRAFDAVFPEPLTSMEADGIGFLQQVSAQETLLGLRHVREVAGVPVVRLQAHTLPSHSVRLKRLMDLALIVLFSPVLLMVVVLVALYARARVGKPVLYRQTRVGRDQVPFQLLKFRTMVADAERDGVQLATAGDPRVVAGMGWIRETRLDELPQLWNVLVGEMSLVGPRPERPEFIERFRAGIPGYERRHELPPGLTGLAQVEARYLTAAEHKLGHDLQYLVNWSPVLDLQILLRTAWVVLARRL